MLRRPPYPRTRVRIPADIRHSLIEIITQILIAQDPRQECRIFLQALDTGVDEDADDAADDADTDDRPRPRPQARPRPQPQAPPAPPHAAPPANSSDAGDDGDERWAPGRMPPMYGGGGGGGQGRMPGGNRGFEYFADGIPAFAHHRMRGAFDGPGRFGGMGYRGF